MRILYRCGAERMRNVGTSFMMFLIYLLVPKNEFDKSNSYNLHDTPTIGAILCDPRLTSPKRFSPPRLL